MIPGRESFGVTYLEEQHKNKVRVGVLPETAGLLFSGGGYRAPFFCPDDGPECRDTDLLSALLWLTEPSKYKKI